MHGQSENTSAFEVRSFPTCEWSFNIFPPLGAGATHNITVSVGEPTTPCLTTDRSMEWNLGLSNDAVPESLPLRSSVGSAGSGK